MYGEPTECLSVRLWKTSDKRIRKREWRNENGDLHNPDGPAIEEWDVRTGRKINEEYLIDGVPHRLEGPAQRTWDAASGTQTTELWMKDGIIHRDGDQPAYVRTHPTTVILLDTSYFVEGELHRETGPAVIERQLDGATIEAWYVHGRLHRGDGEAAYTVWNAEEITIEQQFWDNGIQQHPIIPSAAITPELA